MSAPLSAWGLPPRVEVLQETAHRYRGAVLEYSPDLQCYVTNDRQWKVTVTFVHELWRRFFFPERGQQMELAI